MAELQTMMKRKITHCFFIIFFLLFMISPDHIFAEDENNQPEEDYQEKIIEIEKRIQELKEKIPDKQEMKEEILTKDEQYQRLVSAAGRDYSLRAPGVLGLDYSFEYIGKHYDQIQNAEDYGTFFERESVHTLVNKITIEYPLKDNLSFLMEMPFVKVHDTYQGKDVDMEDFGDPYMGVLFQPLKESETRPDIIISGGVTFPMGRSPYEINPQTEFPTGDGVYSFNLGVNLSKQIDPTLLFGGIFYSHKLSENGLSYKNSLYSGEAGEFLKKVRPGDEPGFNAGMGYVISENVSITLGMRMLYKFPTNYYWRARGKINSASSSLANVFMGTAWQITDKRKIFLDLGIGLTNNDEDFSFKIRVPFNFIL